MVNGIRGFNITTYLTKISSQLDNSLERLSSGLRINSAKDGASELSIAHNLDVNSKTLQQAINNANDAIGILSLADKAMDEQIKIVELIKIKATQAAQDGQSQKTRRIIQEEINLLINSLDNIANNTIYNGLSLLNGSFINKQFQIGNLSNTTINASIGSTQSSSLGTTHFLTSANIIVSGNDLNMSIGSLFDKNTRYDIKFNIGYKEGEGIGELATEINKISDKTGVRADYEVQYKGHGGVKAGWTGNDFSINGVLIGAIEIQDGDKNGVLINAINSQTQYTGVKAFLDENGRLTLDSIDGRGIKIEDSSNSFMALAGLDAKIYTGAKIKDFKAFNDGGVQINGVDIKASSNVQEFVDNINETSEKSGVYAIIEGDQYRIYSVGDPNGVIEVTGNQAKNTGLKFTTFKGDYVDADNALIRYQDKPGISIVYIDDAGVKHTSDFIPFLKSDGQEKFNMYDFADAINATTAQLGFSAKVEKNDKGQLRLSISAPDNVKTIVGFNTNDNEDPNRPTPPNNGAGVLGLRPENLKEATGVRLDQKWEEYGRLSLVSSGVIDIQISGNGVSNNTIIGLDDDLKDCNGAFVSLREMMGVIDKEIADAMGMFANSYNKSDSVFLTLKRSMVLMDIADNSLKTLDSIRSDLGSVQNQLQSAISNITITSINLLSSASNIKDLDFADESANFVKLKIIRESGSLLLSKNNSFQQQMIEMLLK
ncbi:flagellin-like protein [Campylobacter volucris]|uniref:Flagellin n=1 Tax=Campylobacter volucris TaxID=1031542 RepID=A0AAE5YGQ3_9BACT|nr:flagellin-like protein [Campylobacter volucris]AJC94829.1 flagellin-like protein [Campylobacter volucris LMG 24379]KAB0579661.1 flagellin-like protein [Campylobacter volucris]QBL12827.1 flagellin-like protein [Campylobacter volucris]QEL09047.1 flagellin [Campylobacter volucris]TDJ81787.1 flagellin-like protein [Campylobacter volucris]